MQPDRRLARRRRVQREFCPCAPYSATDPQRQSGMPHILADSNRPPPSAANRPSDTLRARRKTSRRCYARDKEDPFAPRFSRQVLEPQAEVLDETESGEDECDHRDIPDWYTGRRPPQP